MLLKRWMKCLFTASLVVSLVGCSHKRPIDQMAVNDANAAYRSDEAQTAGLGEESRFGDQVGGGRGQLLSRRVYYFDFDSNVVHEVDKPAIIANANYLVTHPRARIIVEGHTDPRGSREYNIGLGERRAKAVAAILTSRGANPAQIRVVSYGAEKLASVGHTEVEYQKDRRVVLVYMQ